MKLFAILFTLALYAAPTAAKCNRPGADAHCEKLCSTAVAKVESTDDPDDAIQCTCAGEYQ
ncbi:hypothetical protein HYFRA_00000933 [Hymenoscyphus fraxineus]|uniref:Extracellular membrane protein CFEM domain-containing protein n=1 Tax=Hymenoscyphus fraxineus TaxID=746836 RepID=A0A9N9PR74_9HELO|nr:hypothetical protein HYFRA_00000933 [Hymenoscyphus fraxineus]